MRVIRKLRLSAPDERLIRRGVILVEDAFHTASFPEAAGRRLIIRSLSLGRIRAHQSSASVAIVVEQRIRQLASTAIHAEATNAASYQAVFFRDHVEPYLSLALRIARGDDTTAWFWPLAVPEWNRSQSRDEAIRAILHAVIRKAAGPWAAAILVRELLRQGAIAPLISALRGQDGSDLLRACGWSQPERVLFLVEPAYSAEPSEQVPDDWGRELVRCATQWGEDDSRTIWMAAIAFAAEKPARLEDPRFITRAVGMLRRAVAAHAKPAGRESVSLRHRPPTESTDQARGKSSNGVKSRSAAELTLRRGFGDAAIGSPDPERSSVVHTESTGQRAERTEEPVPPLDLSAGERDEPILLHEDAGQPWSSRQQSDNAGLLFLVPLMTRLGIASMLERHPALIEIDFPNRLLRFAAGGLGISVQDPILLALPRIDQQVCGECEFLVPEIWREGVINPAGFLLTRMRGRTKTRVLFDDSGQIALGLWHGRPAQRIKLTGYSGIRRGRPVEPSDDIDLLLSAWLIAMRRWCRRYAHVGLGRIVRRPGQVSATRTHIDVIFDQSASDLRVRKSGLDLDPGWVPWLGRVISYHYLFGEY